MNYYEILYIVHPALEGGHLQDITKSVDELLEKNGAKVKVQDNWGRKRLAYPIDKQNYGSYILTQFESDGKTNNAILKDLDHNSNVLGSLITKIEKSELITKKDKKEETPAEETPTDETPAEETPTDETPAEESPAEEGLSKDTDSDEKKSKEKD
ncbi:MAG: 30S ribosomal protein S6 [Candidatus Marinimicrobia bacterium]|nr:30S ribosomal protein S6 [Candidatus Neomarinimicrobiota bacterium]